MKPEDIQGRDFLVGLRGYDKDEVRSFLAEVAADHAALLSALESSESDVAARDAAPPVSDGFEDLGASVAAILRTAKESAGEITGAAEARAAEAREAAEQYAADLRQQAEEIRGRATESAEELRRQAAAEAEELRAAAQASLDEAHAEAERILRDATDRASQLEIETEARLNNRADEATRREAALRARLLEANDELQLALMALDGSPAPADSRDDEVEAPAPDLDHQPELVGQADHGGDAPSWS